MSAYIGTRAAVLWTGTVGSGGVVDGTVTTIPLSSATGLTNGKVYRITIDRVDTNGADTPTLREVVSGTLSGTNLINCTRGEEGSAQAHSAGKVIEILNTATHHNELVEALEAEHNSDGTHNLASTDLSDTADLTYNADTDVSGNGWVIDEDNMASDLATKVPTQQSVKAYVDANSGASGDWTTYDAVTPTSGTLDDPTFELVFAGVDLTSTMGVGMKVKYTQSTVKYGIITKIAFSTNTTVTIYGGTDYDLISTGTTAITAFAYSAHKAPLGFPTDPTKWEVKVTDTTLRSETSPPSSGTWYNVGSLSIDVPIGAWNISWGAHIEASYSGGAGTVDVWGTLSKANNTEDDTEFTASQYIQSGTRIGSFAYREKFLVLSTKDTYYFNMKLASVSGTPRLDLRNDRSAFVLKAVCAYL